LKNKLANISNENEFISGDDLKTMKEQNVLPFGQVPILRTPSGLVISQSVAMARFLAAIGNILPQKYEDAAIADSVVDGISDLMGLAVAAHYAPADQKEQKIKDVNATTVPKFFWLIRKFACETRWALFRWQWLFMV